MARTGLNPKGLIWGCPFPNHPFACWQAPSQNWPSAYGLEERVSDPLTHYSVFDVCCQLIRFPFLQKTVHFGALTRISTKALSSIGLSFRNLSDLWSSQQYFFLTDEFEEFIPCALKRGEARGVTFPVDLRFLPEILYNLLHFFKNSQQLTILVYKCFNPPGSETG